MLLAVGLIIVAAVLNLSFWKAYLSPFLMGGAAGATALAGLFCGFALTALDTFCACAGPTCKGACDNMRNTLKAVLVVLGVQTTACLVAALLAWIPVAGLPLMVAVGGALVAQVALIIAVLGFFAQLDNCQLAPPNPGKPPLEPMG